MAVTREVVKEKMIEAVLSNEITPSASKCINSMLEELHKGNPTEERIEAMDRELASMMSNLSGETVDELRERLQHGPSVGAAIVSWAIALGLLFFGIRGLFRAFGGRATLIDILVAGALLFAVEEYFRRRRRAKRSQTSAER